MTRTLILARHAKSSWDDPFLNDHDRPLNNRGRKSAAAIGGWLRKNGWLPDEVISSSSARTHETWDRMGLEAASVEFTQGLYHAGSDNMLSVLNGARGRTVLMIGHNPGIGDFAKRIVRQAPDHLRFYDYPTCATTVIRFEAQSWPNVTWHSGAVERFVIPRELME